MKKGINFIMALSATTTMATAFAAHAESTDLLKKALFDDAKPYIDLRYRYENVDQKGIANDADASTLRTKLGYKTGKLYDFSATVEFLNVAYLGHDDFNNTINGKTQYATVADPDVTELHHAFLTYGGIPGTTINVGRQPVNLDNQRFVGTVGWRQNDQSFDAATITNQSIPDTTLLYGFVNKVHRVFGPDSTAGEVNTTSNLINASYSGWKYGKFTGYGYLLDMDESAFYSVSSKTFGARFSGAAPVADGLKLLYTAEYARQSDYGKNPTNYSANYYTLEGGAEYKGLTGKVGYELLGSDNNGTVSFQTPLATLHAFNGWADKFLTTPAAGLEDIYASVGYKVSGLGNVVDGTQFAVVYHDFSADTGSASYGTEWDASIGRDFMEHYSVLLKFADYSADTFATDTQKIWVQVGVKF